MVAAVALPVIANGDVTDLAGARACMAASGAAGVMVGRAAVGRPWLVGQIADALAGRPARHLGAAEKAAVATEHYEGLLDLYGIRMGVRHARKHLAAYVDGAGAGARGGEGGGAGPGALSAADRTRLLTAGDPELVLALLRRAFLEPACTRGDVPAASIGEAA